MSGGLLAIEACTEGCSVALLKGGEVIERFEEAGRQAARLILPLVESVLAEGGCRLDALDAVAVGVGPGGFTGVRLGVAVAQGLAFGAGLPVVPVCTLETLAFPVLRAGTGDGVLACLDARMGGIYWGCYRTDPDWGVLPIESPALDAPAALEMRLRAQALPAVGRGMRLLRSSGDWPAPCAADALPRAADMARLALRRLARGGALDPADLKPLYVRDRVALTEAERRTPDRRPLA